MVSAASATNDPTKRITNVYPYFMEKNQHGIGKP
jgi:hypothetical protein